VYQLCIFDNIGSLAELDFVVVRLNTIYCFTLLENLSTSNGAYEMPNLFSTVAAANLEAYFGLEINSYSSKNKGKVRNKDQCMVTVQECFKQEP